ncbi:hypothetical protein [Roseateles koreensis]|uniref:Transporter n=1 Tax=Roseateles koreensis TaxID=2987526 RepID=A0ABT5KQ67_9BURK|nr:hypothetical protein [Roseateles koreensis]MDC8784595.1 hypothetical protein [Roseateles koreensis]
MATLNLPFRHAKFMRALGLGLLAFWGAVSAIHAQDSSAKEAAKSTDKGTDPTVVSYQAYGKYEYMDLNQGLSSGTLRLGYIMPIGEHDNYSLRFELPVMKVDGLGGNARHDLGDAAIRLGHVFGLTRTHGWVAQAEAIFDTASRPELGRGKNILKGTLIYARFLKDGGIFAPAWVQSVSVSGQAQRSKVNSTTVDFYYVPKLADSQNLLTYDPAINYDWENKSSFVSLAITAGRVIGQAFGGNAIVFVKPTLFAGGARPGNWGLELGYKVVGF